MGGAARKTENWHGCDHNTPTERPDAGPHENTSPPNPAQHPARPRLPYGGHHTRPRPQPNLPTRPTCRPHPHTGSTTSCSKTLVEFSAE